MNDRKATIRATAQLGPSFGAFETVKITREFTQLTGDTNGLTIGQRLDEHLLDCARNGVEVQSIKLHLDEDAWPKMADAMREAESYS
jgi:hypothetical protein